MKITDIVKKTGFETDVCRICKFLGFEDTNQLKSMKFFSQEESYSSIPFIGWLVSNGNMTWRICQVVDESEELFSIDYGYKITLEICDGSGIGRHRYYQSDFLSHLKSGLIIPYTEKSYIKHIKWSEPLTESVELIHEADIVIYEGKGKII